MTDSFNLTELKRLWRNAKAIDDAMSHEVWDTIGRPDDDWIPETFQVHLARTLVDYGLERLLDEPDCVVAVKLLHREVQRQKAKDGATSFAGLPKDEQRACEIMIHLCRGTRVTKTALKLKARREGAAIGKNKADELINFLISDGCLDRDETKPNSGVIATEKGKKLLG